MWRRASSKLLALRSVFRPNRIVNSSISPVILRPAANIVTRHYSGNVSKKVEDVMPIATGHEREELDAELEGRDILDINFPEGPFGTKDGRALSNMLFNGFRSNQYSRTTSSEASGPFLQHGMRFSTNVPSDPSDPDTHDDFKPKNKLVNSEITLKDIVKQDIKDNNVMIYMKGDPEQPRCGFSSLAVRVLSEYRVPIHSRNILEDPELKNAVKDFSTWPTFPQIFINGEFIGGSDIILQMHQSGELKEKLKVTSSE